MTIAFSSKLSSIGIMMILVLGLAAKVSPSFFGQTQAVDVIIGLLTTYGIYLEVSYSKKFSASLQSNFKGTKLLVAKIYISIVWLIVLGLVFFVVAPLLAGLTALLLGAQPVTLSATTTEAIFGAMIAGMVFYWFEEMLS